MGHGCFISAVIPTRNRPFDLAAAVASVCCQTRKPDELIIIDQSSSAESHDAVTRQTTGSTSIPIIYIHDPTITGLVDAKRVAVEMASGDIVCFLEDDVILETDYISMIEQGFYEHKTMLGCSGVVTNPPHQPFYYVLAYQIFHRGIFRDPRVGIYGRDFSHDHGLIMSDVLSGGLSAWRKDVFLSVHFDTRNGFFMLEDIDFSTRVVSCFGRHLYINPRARLEHRCSLINREDHGMRHRRKTIEYIVYYKKRRELRGAHTAMLWLMLGLLLEALYLSVTSKSIHPLRNYISGIKDGFKKKLHPVSLHI